VHADYKPGELKVEAYQRPGPADFLKRNGCESNDAKLQTLIKAIFDSADKNVDTGSVNKLDVERWLVKL